MRNWGPLSVLWKGGVSILTGFKSLSFDCLQCRSLFVSRFSPNLEAFLFSCLCFQSSSTKSFLLGVAAELCSHCSSVAMETVQDRGCSNAKWTCLQTYGKLLLAVPEEMGRADFESREFQAHLIAKHPCQTNTLTSMIVWFLSRTGRRGSRSRKQWRKKMSFQTSSTNSLRYWAAVK